MDALTATPERRKRLVAWSKLALGMLLVAGVVLGLMQGWTPPGPAGEVFRNNLRHEIDATPLFYTEVESLVPDD